MKGDVTRLDDHRRAVAVAIDSFGSLDIFVNNAGVASPETTIVDESEESWDRTLAINAKGVWLGCKAAVETMQDQPLRERTRGRIINIASVLGLVGDAMLGSYCASKGAVVLLTRALAVECAPLRINVNAIAPGYVRTAMIRSALEQSNALAKAEARHPWGGVGDVEDVAEAAVFLASDRAAWITGAVLAVDGGYSAW